MMVFRPQQPELKKEKPKPLHQENPWSRASDPPHGLRLFPAGVQSNVPSRGNWDKQALGSMCVAVLINTHCDMKSLKIEAKHGGAEL